jgi:hypothetical protein
MSITSATSTTFIAKLLQIHHQSTTLQKKFRYIELQFNTNTYLTKWLPLRQLQPPPTSVAIKLGSL